jgi:hypothetical protein
MLQLRLMQAKTSACVIALLLRVKTSNGNMMLWSNLCCPYLHHCNQCTPRSKCDAWIWPLLPAFASLQSMHTPIKVWCLDLTIAARIRITAINAHPDQSVMLGSDHCCPYSHHYNQCTPQLKCDAWIWPLLPVFASLQSMHTPIKVWCLDLTIAARIRITATATRPKGPERLHKQDGTPRRVCLQVGTSSDKTVPTLGACTRI